MPNRPPSPEDYYVYGEIRDTIATMVDDLQEMSSAMNCDSVARELMKVWALMGAHMNRWENPPPPPIRYHEDYPF